MLIVCGELERAIRQESKPAITYWWGVSLSTVFRWRVAIGAQAWTPGSLQRIKDRARRCGDQLRGVAKTWLPEHDAILGTVPDRDAAVMLGCSAPAVSSRRRRVGIPRIVERLDPIPWTAEMDSLLGTMFDREVAAQLGITKAMVVNRRRLLGVAAFGQWPSARTATPLARRSQAPPAVEEDDEGVP